MGKIGRLTGLLGAVALAGITAVCLAVVPPASAADDGYFWRVLDPTVECFTNDNDVTGYLIQGAAESNLPDGGVAVVINIDGGGDIDHDPDLDFSLGVGSTLPTTATVTVSLFVDDVLTFLQTMEVTCAEEAPATGESYEGALVLSEDLFETPDEESTTTTTTGPGDVDDDGAVPVSALPTFTG